MARCRLMSPRASLEVPGPRVRSLAVPVAQVKASIRQLIDDMFETMYAAPGIGLAASQVDVHERIIVMDITEDHSDPRVFINPDITVIDHALGTTISMPAVIVSKRRLHCAANSPDTIQRPISTVTGLPPMATSAKAKIERSKDSNKPVTVTSSAGRS